MNNILTNLHNFAHTVSSKIEAWVVANPKYALYIAIFLGGLIIGSILF
jgi:hypothetical protein